MNQPTATNLDHRTAGSIKQLMPDTVMISINEEHAPLYDLQLDRNSKDVLTLQFSDVTASITVNDKRFNPIDSDQILSILNFINIHKGKDFIIHCAAGVSRSAAICYFLNQMHGYKLKDKFWDTSHPNPYVLGCLMARARRADYYESIFRNPDPRVPIPSLD